MNGKIYIGKHQCDNPFEDYIGSGLLLQNAINKHGLENFEKTVLYIFDNEKEMNQKEIEIVNEEFILREDTYNIALGGQGGRLTPYRYKLDLSEAERIRRSKQTIDVHTGRKRSVETKEKMRMSQLGKTKSLDERNKIREGVINSMPSYICPVCNKTGKGGAMKAYHFDNCKFNKS